jgi:hypothetical protein
MGTREPEASMLTNRPPKPLEVTLYDGEATENSRYDTPWAELLIIPYGRYILFSVVRHRKYIFLIIKKIASSIYDSTYA